MGGLDELVGAGLHQGCKVNCNRVKAITNCTYCLSDGIEGEAGYTVNIKDPLRDKHWAAPSFQCNNHKFGAAHCL